MDYPRGKVLLALLSSSVPLEQRGARAAVRAALAEYGSTSAAAVALDVSARTLQRLLKNHPKLRPVGLRRRGRPTTHKDSQPT